MKLLSGRRESDTLVFIESCGSYYSDHCNFSVKTRTVTPTSTRITSIPYALLESQEEFMGAGNGGILIAAGNAETFVEERIVICN